MAVIAVAAVSVVGLAIYAVTRTVKVPGQKLGDIAVQTAKEGEPRLIVYGVVRPVGGNLIAVQEPPRIQKKKVKSGGKGGGGSSQTVEIPRRTYAVGICEGPITGIRRVWRNNKLVYDGRGTAWGRRNNGVFLNTFKFYLGGWDQMPDPSLQSVFGAANVPPHRGTAYMVAKDEDLQDTGGAVPQWLFEVVRAEGTAITSRPYPLEVIESAASTEGFTAPAPFIFDDAAQSAGGAVVDGSLRDPLVDYPFYAPESAQSLGGGVAAGSLTDTAAPAEMIFSESATSVGGQAISGSLQSALVRYQNYATESAASAGGAVISGSLT